MIPVSCTLVFINALTAILIKNKNNRPVTTLPHFIKAGLREGRSSIMIMPVINSQKKRILPNAHPLGL
jgi:hypothetical protein